MINDKQEYDSIIKKRFNIIISILMVLLLSFIILILFINQHDKKQLKLIDVLGYQRMLSQNIVKDVNLKYIYILNEDRSSIEAINQRLTHMIDDYNSTLQGIKNGELMIDNELIKFKNIIELADVNQVVNRNEANWETFSQNIEVIISSNEIEENKILSLNYLNQYNVELLESSHEVLDIIIIKMQNEARLYFVMMVIFSLLIIPLLVYLIIKLYKYIIIPLNEIYRGVNSLGLLVEDDLPSKHELKPIIKDLNEGFIKFNQLKLLIENINQETSFEASLKYIYNSFNQFIPYNHIGIALLKEDGKVLEATYGISDKALNGLSRKLKGIRANIENTSLGNLIDRGEPRVINDLEKYVTGDSRKKDYNQRLFDAGIKSSITLPLQINNMQLGAIFFSSTQRNIYTEEHLNFLRVITNSISISFYNNIFIEDLLYTSILALAKLAEARDEDTGDHLERMKSYSMKVAEILSRDSHFSHVIDFEYIKQIEKFSPLHDIGKVGIPDNILLKPDKLTPEEFEKMKMHTVYGAEVVKTAEKNIAKYGRTLFKMGIEVVEAHHEKWDGSGYPNHLKGEEIPLSARIVTVADVIDALTSKRPYKSAFSFEAAFDIIVEGKGKHFDPKIVDCLIKNRDEMYQLYLDLNEKSI